MTTPRVLSDSPFDTLEKTFRLLCAGPRPLALDGSAFPGLPERSVPLDELKAILLHPSTAYSLRDAVVAELVTRARRDGTWLVGLAGVLLPGLRCAAWPFAQACPDKEADIESEMLAAFVAAVRRASPAHPRLATHLTWRAQARAKRLVRAEMAEWARPALRPVSAAPPRPGGHPDLVLEKAVGYGVLCREDAELIGATRIGDVALATAASRLGITYAAARKRRIRAEAVLAEWLTNSYSGIALGATNRTPRSRQSIPEQGRRGRPRHGSSDPQKRI